MRGCALADVRPAGLAAAATGLLIAACSTAADTAAPSGAGVRGLFRAGGGASYPNGGGGWYSPAQPPHFSRSGTATWHGQPARRRGVGAWLARVFKRRPPAEPALPTAVIAADAPLALPSVVIVTNIQTYATLKLRVEQRTPLRGALISLPREAAAALGGEAGKPLAVRVRYAGPAIAYRERPDLRQALRRPARRDVQLAAAAAPIPLPPARAEVPPIVDASAVTPLRLRPAIRPPLPGGWRVQAGAFAERRNADRAVVLLKAAGPAAVEIVQRGERTLYRVSLLAPADSGGAEALRRKVVQAGFADARLVRLS